MHTPGTILSSRRAFMAGVTAAAAPLVFPSIRAAAAADEVDRSGALAPGSFPGLITREREPLNLEFPFPTLKQVVTPTNQFYVRSHFAIPKVDPAAWRLTCEGHVDHDVQLTIDQLRKLPAKTLTATLECAGNSRGFLVPKAKGVPWELGGIGTAEWTGVPLSVVLDQAGVRPGAVDVILQGADKGTIPDDPKVPGEIHFERSLPLEKARQAEVLLAYQMNGQDLTAEHGYPLRALVAGWYGMASVKWLTRIIVTREPFQGFWQTTSYSYLKPIAGEPTQVPVRQMQVKSEIARPCLHEVVPAGSTYRVFGAAWAGEGELARVEVSTDNGKQWHAAVLLGKAIPFAWRLWEYPWQVPRQSGSYTLMSKATDKQGHTQAATHSPDRRGYMISHTLPITIDVR